MVNGHVIRWTAPSPLWPELTSAITAVNGQFGAPAILRFATDTFMEDYMNVLATDPRKLGEFRAIRETWRGRVVTPTVATPAKSFARPLQRLGSRFRRTTATGAKSPSSTDANALARLKLYQPAHQRHYLVTTCLVCASPGLPDRKVDPAHEEKVSFVMRRVLPPTIDDDSPAEEWPEFAWTQTPAGYAWVKVDDGKTVLENEELLPLFPANFAEDDARRRRLFSGIIPVAKREAYLGAQQRLADSISTQPTGTTSKTARKILLRKTVIEPWKRLVEQMAAGAKTTSDDESVGDGPSPGQRREALRIAREQAQVISWLILADLADFLREQIPSVWDAIGDAARAADISNPHELELLAAFDKAVLNDEDLVDAILKEYINPHTSALKANIYSETQVPGNLLQALELFKDGSAKARLEATEGPYDRDPASNRDDWPPFAFPLADPEFPNLVPLTPGTLNVTLASPESADLVDGAATELDKFAALIVRALPIDAIGPEPEIPTAAQTPANASLAFFRIRCVYLRPRCGPLHEDVVSEPTEVFELAGFFDPDAPARPIRIGLPIDTSPAGLRKFDKNTAFIMSDILCGQVQKMKSLTFGDLVRSVLPWPFHKDLSVGDMGPCSSGAGGNFGMICSFSIPIITICALLLLMIIVTLLDFIFRWLPFFLICFPIRGFKAKK